MLLSEAPIVGGFVSASGDLVPRATCRLKMTTTPGLSTCSFEFATDNHTHGFVRHAPRVIFTGTYSGETTHSTSTGSGGISVVTVHACFRAGLEFEAICNAAGQLAGAVKTVINGATRTTTYALLRLSVTMPNPCVRSGRRFTVKLTVVPAKGDHLRLRRVDFTFGRHRSTAKHSPFSARLAAPRRAHSSPTLTAHIVFADPPTRDFARTVKLAVPIC
jgi:hypothetical protein